MIMIIMMELIFLFSFRCYYYVWMPVISYDLMEFSFIVHVPTYEDKISVNGIVHISFLSVFGQTLRCPQLHSTDQGRW